MDSKIQCNDDVQAATAATNIERFGGPSPTCDPEIFMKQQKAGHRLKEEILPSGRIVSVQGYEPQAIRFLLSEGIKEQDLIFDNSLMPQIRYPDPVSGKNRRYYPDMFIPTCILIIEVKSPYTMENDYDVNMAKKKACEDLGFVHIIMIFNEKGDLLEII